MIDEIKIKEFNIRIKQRIIEIIDSNNFNFLLNKRNANILFRFFKIDKDDDYWVDISEENFEIYLKTIDSFAINSLWNLNNGISTIFYKYLNKIERKIKKKFFDFFMQLPLDFFTNLFFKRDKNHQKILKNNKDYNSLTKEKYDTFYKYFFKPFIKELETLYKNQYLQNSDKVISNLDEELFKEKLKTFITRNFYSLTPTYKLMFGELITFIYVTSYQLDWCGIRTTDNFDQLNCFKILFKDYNFGEENTIFTHETKNIIEIIEWFKKTNIWFLSIIKEMRNLVSHGSFFISTNIDITNIVHYYSYYNDFPTWKKPIINNLKTLGCSIEQREISFCNKVLSTLQKRLDNNALSMMKDSLNTFSKNQFYLDPRYWLNNSIFSELTKLSLNELLDIDLYSQKDINDLSSFLDSIYVDDVIKKFAKNITSLI